MGLVLAGDPDAHPWVAIRLFVRDSHGLKVERAVEPMLQHLEKAFAKLDIDAVKHDTSWHKKESCAAMMRNEIHYFNGRIGAVIQSSGSGKIVLIRSLEDFSFTLIRDERPLTEHVHLAFAAQDDATVRAFHAAALAAGYEDNGGPGERPVYHPGYYGAFVLDPDGHNVEVVNHNR